MTIWGKWYRDPWLWALLLGGPTHVATHYATYVPAIRSFLRGVPYFNLHALHEAEFLLIIAIAAYRYRLWGGTVAILGTAVASIPFMLSPFIFGRDPRSGEIRDLVIQTVLTLIIGGFIVFMNELHSRQKDRSAMLLREIQETQEQLVQTTRLAMAGELAAGVAHEVNNPLTVVMGYAQLLLAKDMDGESKQDLQIMYQETERASAIIRNLLSFAGQQPAEKHSVSVTETVEHVLNLRAYHFRSANIEVISDFQPDIPETYADPQQLQQVFLNLVINAEQAMADSHGGGRLLIRTRQVDDTVQTIFSDNGPGIPKDNLPRIFDPFYTTKAPGKGTGLGLSICHGIIQAHGGTIRAESEENEGATLVVSLPLNKAPASQLSTEAGNQH